MTELQRHSTEMYEQEKPKLLTAVWDFLLLVAGRWKIILFCLCYKLHQLQRRKLGESKYF